MVCRWRHSPVHVVPTRLFRSTSPAPTRQRHRSSPGSTIRSWDLQRATTPRSSVRSSTFRCVEKSAVSVGFDGNIDLTGVKGMHPHCEGGRDAANRHRWQRVSDPRPGDARPGSLVQSASSRRSRGRTRRPRSRWASTSAPSSKSPSTRIEEAASSTYNGPPYAFPKITIVGEIVINSTVIQDEINALGSSVVLMSPALTKQLETCCAYYSGVAVILRGGAGQREAIRIAAARGRPDRQARYRRRRKRRRRPWRRAQQRDQTRSHRTRSVRTHCGHRGAILIAGLDHRPNVARSGAAEMRTLQRIGRQHVDVAVRRVDGCIVRRGRRGRSLRWRSPSRSVAARAARTRALRLSRIEVSRSTGRSWVSGSSVLVVALEVIAARAGASRTAAYSVGTASG